MHFSVWQTLKNGVAVPLGEVGKKNDLWGGAYNEYIVYDETRVRIKYVLLLQLR
jgi:hypothetical protein